jgi:Tol biopolymer transport system component
MNCVRRLPHTAALVLCAGIASYILSVTACAVAADTDELKFVPGDFTGPKHKGFFLLPSDGGPAKPLGTLPNVNTMGSPTYSTDGQWIAFDAVRHGSNFNNSEIMVMRADGSELHSLGDGLMPSWSSDGTKIAISRYAQGNSVWVCDVVSGEKTQLDDAGWGIQWSPDGNYWAFSKRGALIVKHVKSSTTYEYPFAPEGGGWTYNYAWSPDGTQICGVVGLENGQEALMVIKLKLDAGEMIGRDEKRVGEFQLVIANKSEMSKDVAWHPSAPRIVTAQFLVPAGKMQLFEYNPDVGAPPWPMPGQTPTNNYDHCWSPDGKWLLYVGQYPE